jgi:SAM-dependent methyltransferase
MNLDPSIPLKDESVDACLAVAAWQYWTQPENVAAEMLRVTRPNGTAIVAFSNRMFFTKAPQVWTDNDDKQHLDYVGTVLQANGWTDVRVFAEETKAGGLMGLVGGKGDPFFAVVARKNIY